MKKHFWRILTVLLMACLGIGILAACGDGTEPENPDNPENPAVTDPIEGVWTGATATGLFGSRTANDTFTATVDLIEGQAHAGYVVVKATEGEDDYYFAFGIDKDGENYKGSMSVGSETPVSITVSLADNKLTAVVPFGEEPTTLTFTSRNATLPAAIAPTGTLYAEVNSHVTYKIDFTAKKLYAKMGSGSYTEQNVKFINVGDYIGIEPTGEGTEGAGLVPVFKSGSDYYIFVVAAGEAPIKLTANEPTPAPATTYTVQFELGDHGTTTEEVTNEATEGETLTSEDFPDVTAKKGYTFTGWKIGTKDVTTSYEVDPTDAVGTTITLTAQYDYIEYAIEYVKGEVAGDPSSMPQNPTEKVSLENGHNKFTLPTAEPTLTDHVFDGWKLGTRDLGKTNTEITITVNDLPDNPADPTQAKLTITAQWHSNNQILVTYEVDSSDHITGSVPGSATVAKNGSVSLPEAPTAAKGYRFDAWYVKDANGSNTKAGDNQEGTADATHTVGTENINFIAKYVAIKYTIAFDKNGGAAEIDSVQNVTIEDQDGIDLSTKTTTRTGYTLTGWTNGETTLEADATFKLSEHTDLIPAGTADGTTITLTADWEAKTYQVTLEKGAHGELNGEGTVEATYGEPLTLTDPTPDAGYTFKGWFLSASGDDQFTSGSNWTTDGTELKLYAQYEVITYVVKYASGVAEDTGVNGMPEADGSVSVESPLTLPTDPTREGYTFAGWQVPGKQDTVKKSDETLTLDDDIIAQATDGTEADQGKKVITLTATWTKVYTVEFALGEHGQGSAPEKQENQKVGDTVTLTPPTAADDWEFDGWYTENETKVSGEQYTVAAADDKNNDGKITLTAHWNSLVPTVTIEAGGAEKGDGDLTLTPTRGAADKYEITLPEITVYTAPAGTYFRGYTYGGKTYFPGEKITGIEPKTQVQITLVWQNLSQEVTEESVTLDKWNLVLTSGYIISKDEPVIIQGTYKETLGVVYAGLVAQIRAEAGGANLYFLRPDNAYCYDAAMTASWDTASDKVSTSGTFVGEENKAEVKGVKWEFTLNTDTDTLIAKQTIYGDAGSNLGEGTYTITGMTADSYRVDFALDVGITSDDMKVTYHRHYNTPEAFKVGESEETKTGFTGENVPWISLIKKGEKVVLTGTMKSTALQNYHSALAYLWSSGNKPVRGIFRADNFIGDGKVDTDGNGTIDWLSDTDQMANGANIKATEGWEIQQQCANTKSDGELWAIAKETFADCTLTITFDYTNESKIVITMAFVGVSNENTFTQTYTITAAADKALRDEYQIGLGGEEVFIDITSVELSHAAAD